MLPKSTWVLGLCILASGVIGGLLGGVGVVVLGPALGLVGATSVDECTPVAVLDVNEFIARAQGASGEDSEDALARGLAEAEHLAREFAARGYVVFGTNVVLAAPEPLYVRLNASPEGRP